MTALITDELVVLDLPATDRQIDHPGPRRAAAGRRPGHRPRRVPRRRRAPARSRWPPACPAASASRTPARPTSPCRRSASPGYPAGVDFGADGRPGQPGLPDRRPGRRRLRPPDDPGGARPPARPPVVPHVPARGRRRRDVADIVNREVVTPMKFVAVTSCPTGIAHTYMAAEALEQAARAAGHEIEVETQGAAGATPLAARGHRRGRRRDLRARRRGPGPGPVRRQAAHRRRRQAARSRRPGADRRGRARPRSTPPAAAVAAVNPLGGGGPGSPEGDRGRRGRHPGAAVADDRRELHDPVRRRRAAS